MNKQEREEFIIAKVIEFMEFEYLGILDRRESCKLVVPLFIQSEAYKSVPDHSVDTNDTMNQHEIEMIHQISKLNEIAAANLNKYFEQELERRWNAIVWKNQNYKASVLPVYERLKEQLTKPI